MDKIPETTPDLAAEKTAKLLELFPECAGERGEVDWEMLKQTLADHVIDGDVERYQFTWPGKRAAMAEANVPTTKTLAPCEAESVNFATTENLYIEGDNLEVLKILRSSYLGQVKMIYIDPPYNTGKDFVYHDRFSITQAEADERGGNIDDLGKRFTENSESNPRYHSDWCSMMYPRLKLARDLMRDDGVLFMSIDDNEVVNARKLCDDVFGEENFVTQFVWEKGKEGGNDSSLMRSHFDYIVCYCRVVSSSGVINLDAKDTSRHINQLPEPNLVAGIEREENIGEPFQLINLSKQKDYSVSIPLTDGTIIQWPSYAPQTSIDAWMKTGKLFVGAKRVPYVRSFLKDELQGQKPSNIITQEFGTSKAGSIEIREFFGSREIFPYPKPSLLIKRLLSIGAKDDSLVLDFFSGSATTAHAVMQLNAEDGGKRKFIMVQLPEVCPEGSEAAKAGWKNICEIGKERIRRAGKKIVEELKAKREEKGKDLFGRSDEDVASPLDVGFRVLKVVESPMVDASRAAGETTQQELSFSSVKTGVTDGALLFHTLLRMGIRPTESIAYQMIEGNRVACVGGVALVAALDANTQMTNGFIEAVAKLNPGVAVFRDDTFRNNNALRISLEQTFKQLSKETKLEVI